MNPKSIGEKAECIVIGELAKWCIDVALPMSDNHPFDMILILKGKLLKAQVKSCSRTNSNNAISFDLATSNWYLGDTRNYSSKDCDVVLCYDWRNNYLYILSPIDFENRRSFSIRIEQPKNNTSISTCHFHKDYVISKERIEKVFGVEAKNISEYFSVKNKTYTLICKKCGQTFESKSNWLKFCCKEHRNEFLSRSKVKPPREELQNLLHIKTPYTQIGKKYGVTDNAVRKWARGYGLI